jgi:preprotein translocase subunit SecE
MSRNDPVLVIAGQPPEIFPGSGLPVPAPVAWPTRREAVRAAVTVACFVGVPALAAVGAVFFLFALSAAVLVAPLVVAALTWTAWYCNRVPARRPSRGGSRRREDLRRRT